MANSHMRTHAPEKLSEAPNFGNLYDIETKTCTWEQTQRPLYLKHLERSQQPPASGESAGRVAFPTQLVRDLNVLRQRGAASGATSSGATAAGAAGPAGAVGSGITPGSGVTPSSGGSVGSTEQVSCG